MKLYTWKENYDMQLNQKKRLLNLSPCDQLKTRAIQVNWNIFLNFYICLIITTCLKFMLYNEK